jgi:hypothetical protein
MNDVDIILIPKADQSPEIMCQNLRAEMHSLGFDFTERKSANNLKHLGIYAQDAFTVQKAGRTLTFEVTYGLNNYDDLHQKGQTSAIDSLVLNGIRIRSNSPVRGKIELYDPTVRKEVDTYMTMKPRPSWEILSYLNICLSLNWFMFNMGCDPRGHIPFDVIGTFFSTIFTLNFNPSNIKVKFFHRIEKICAVLYEDLGLDLNIWDNFYFVFANAFGSLHVSFRIFEKVYTSKLNFMMPIIGQMEFIHTLFDCKFYTRYEDKLIHLEKWWHSTFRRQNGTEVKKIQAWRTVLYRWFVCLLIKEFELIKNTTLSPTWLPTFRSNDIVTPSLKYTALSSKFSLLRKKVQRREIFSEETQIWYELHPIHGDNRYPEFLKIFNFQEFISSPSVKVKNAASSSPEVVENAASSSSSSEVVENAASSSSSEVVENAASSSSEVVENAASSSSEVVENAASSSEVVEGSAANVDPYPYENFTEEWGAT